MKKTLTILLSLAMVAFAAGFTACSGFGNQSSESSSSQESNSSTPDSQEPDSSENEETQNYYPVLEVYTNATKIMKGQTFQVEPVVTYGGEEVEATITYTSDNTAILTVDANGLVSCLSAGTANVKVACTYNGVNLEETVEITVENAYSFAFLDDEIVVGAGETVTASYYLYENDEPLENADIDWSVEDEAVATVDNNGVVTGVGYGETVLYAEFANVEISVPVKCYIPAYEGEINSFCHESRMEYVSAKNMTTGAEVPYEFISDAVAGKTPTNGNFVKFAATKNHSYPGLYLNPMTTKADLETLLENGAKSVKFSIYIEKVDATTERRLLKQNWGGKEVSIMQVPYDTWTEVSLDLNAIIANYDRFASQTDALFWIPNTGSTTDILLVPSSFNVYVDSIMVVKPNYTHYTISSVADFWKINNDMSENAYYTLTQDLDFSEHEFNYDVESTDGSWHSIGWNADPNKIATFKGTFDGNGFALKNVKLRGYSAVQAIYASIFGITDGATIKNLYVDMELANDLYANSAKLIGLVGYASYTTVKNCYVRLKTNQAGYGSNYNGPIISHALGCVINNCVSVLDVSSGFISSNTTTIGSVFGLAHGAVTTVKNTFGVMIRSESDTQSLKIVGSGSPSLSGTSVTATLSETYTAISATGVLTAENGWNLNLWKVENNSLKFGDEVIFTKA